MTFDATRLAPFVRPRPRAATTTVTTTMGRTRHGGSRRSPAHRSTSSSSSDDTTSSSSDDDGSRAPRLEAARYEAAQLAAGLANRAFRLAALRELLAVLQQGLYANASKGVQAAVFADLLVAAQQHDSRVGVREATLALLAAARRVLPQQRRQALAAGLKQAGVAASRAARKQGAAGCSAGADSAAGSDDEDGAGVMQLNDVPLEVVSRILQGLDPCSLAAAACTCRSWHALATRDELWRHSLSAAFPKAARRLRVAPQQQPQQPEAQQQPQAQEEGSVCRLFAAKATRNPQALLPWRSCRALVCGKLQWRLPAGPVAAAGGSGGEDAAAALAAARTAQQGVVPPGPLYVSTVQVVKWMLRRPMREVVRPDDAQHDTSSSEGSGSGSDGGCGTRLARLRLWAAPTV